MPASPDLRTALVYAVKPASWPKLVVPALLGTALGFAAAGRLDPAGGAFAWAYTLWLLLGIVLLNDWADVEVDRLKRRMFPESGSPKTIPDGFLCATAVFRLGTGALCAAAGTAVWLAGATGRAEPFVFGAVGILSFAAYSLPPVRINATGGGEILEAMGVGAVLPVFHATVHAPRLTPADLAPLLPYTFLSFASAVASGLADERSDRRGGKVTVATVWGNRFARRVTEAAWAGGTVAYAVLPAIAPTVPWPAAWAAAATSLYFGARMLAESPRALPDAWDEIRTYKGHLHHAIWGSGLVLALGVVAAELW